MKYYVIVDNETANIVTYDDEETVEYFAERNMYTDTHAVQITKAEYKTLKRILNKVYDEFENL